MEPLQILPGSFTRPKTQATRPLKHGEHVMEQIYQTKLMPLVSQQRYKDALTLIAKEFTTLCQQNSENNTIPPLLQEALVVLIMCKKEESDNNINKNDFKTAVEDLHDTLIAEGEVDNAIAVDNYLQEPRLLCLLEQGVQNYNQKLDARVELATAGWERLPDSVCMMLNEYLRTDRINWANGCHTFNNFYQHQNNWPLVRPETVTELEKQRLTRQQFLEQYPECRPDKDIPVNPEGRLYLRQSGIGGPINHQKLMNGEVTVEELTEIKMQILEAVENNDQLCLDFFDKPEIQQLLVDGSLTPEQVDEHLTDYEVDLLCLPFLQDCMDNQILCSRDVITHARFLSPLCKMPELTNMLQAHFDRGWSFAKILEIRAQGGPKSLHGFSVSENEQKFIDDGIFTVEELLKLPEYQRDLLKHSNTHLMLEKKWISFEEMMQLPREEALNLLVLVRNSGLQLMLEKKLISLQEMMQLPYKMFSKLLKPEVQKHILNGSITIPVALEIQFFTIVSYSGRREECPLTDGAIQTLIDNKTITIGEALACTNAKEVKTLAEAHHTHLQGYNADLR